MMHLFNEWYLCEICLLFYESEPFQASRFLEKSVKQRKKSKNSQKLLSKTLKIRKIPTRTSQPVELANNSWRPPPDPQRRYSSRTWHTRAPTAVFSNCVFSSFTLEKNVILQEMTQLFFKILWNYKAKMSKTVHLIPQKYQSFSLFVGWKSGQSRLRQPGFQLRDFHQTFPARRLVAISAQQPQSCFAACNYLKKSLGKQLVSIAFNIKELQESLLKSQMFHPSLSRQQKRKSPVVGPQK